MDDNEINRLLADLEQRLKKEINQRSGDVNMDVIKNRIDNDKDHSDYRIQISGLEKRVTDLEKEVGGQTKDIAAIKKKSGVK